MRLDQGFDPHSACFAWMHLRIRHSKFNLSIIFSTMDCDVSLSFLFCFWARGSGLLVYFACVTDINNPKRNRTQLTQSPKLHGLCLGWRFANLGFCSSVADSPLRPLLKRFDSMMFFFFFPPIFVYTVVYFSLSLCNSNCWAACAEHYLGPNICANTITNGDRVHFPIVWYSMNMW